MIKNNDFDREYKSKHIKIKKRNPEEAISNEDDFHRKTYIGSASKEEATSTKVRYLRRGNKIIIEHLKEN